MQYQSHLENIHLTTTSLKICHKQY